MIVLYNKYAGAIAGSVGSGVLVLTVLLVVVITALLVFIMNRRKAASGIYYVFVNMYILSLNSLSAVGGPICIQTDYCAGTKAAAAASERPNAR